MLYALMRIQVYHTVHTFVPNAKCKALEGASEAKTSPPREVRTLSDIFSYC